MKLITAVSDPVDRRGESLNTLSSGSNEDTSRNVCSPEMVNTTDEILVCTCIQTVKIQATAVVIFLNRV